MACRRAYFAARSALRPATLASISLCVSSGPRFTCAAPPRVLPDNSIPQIPRRFAAASRESKRPTWPILGEDMGARARAAPSQYGTIQRRAYGIAHGANAAQIGIVAAAMTAERAS